MQALRRRKLQTHFPLLPPAQRWFAYNFIRAINLIGATTLCARLA